MSNMQGNYIFIFRFMHQTLLAKITNGIPYSSICMPYRKNVSKIILALQPGTRNLAVFQKMKTKSSG